MQFVEAGPERDNLCPDRFYIDFLQRLELSGADAREAVLSNIENHASSITNVITRVGSLDGDIELACRVSRQFIEILEAKALAEPCRTTDTCLRLFAALRKSGRVRELGFHDLHERALGVMRQSARSPDANTLALSSLACLDSQYMREQAHDIIREFSGQPKRPLENENLVGFSVLARMMMTAVGAAIMTDDGVAEGIFQEARAGLARLCEGILVCPSVLARRVQSFYPLAEAALTLACWGRGEAQEMACAVVAKGLRGRSTSRWKAAMLSWDPAAQAPALWLDAVRSKLGRSNDYPFLVKFICGYHASENFLCKELGKLSKEMRVEVLHNLCLELPSWEKQPALTFKKVLRKFEGELVRDGRLAIALMSYQEGQRPEILRGALAGLDRSARFSSISELCSSDLCPYIVTREISMLLSEEIFLNVHSAADKFSRKASKLWLDCLANWDIRCGTAWRRPFERFCEMHGLEANELYRSFGFGAWGSAAPLEEQPELFQRSCWVIDQIDRACPGGAAFLREKCGIRIFGRYDPEILLKQISYFQKRGSSQIEKGQYIAVFYPIRDRDGSHFQNYDHSVLEMACKYYGTPVIFTESACPRELFQHMLRTANSLGRLRHVVIGGHGDKYGVVLDQFSDLIPAHVSELKLGPLLRRIFAEDGELVLLPCMMGKKGGFSDVISKQLEGMRIKIFAKMGKSYVHRLRITHPAESGLRLHAQFATAPGMNDTRILVA
ncbi:MAG: hypothetical protein DCC75_02775 [Proteobacteria bacterium]|nr:MAG: hypothetical protein DCC75_02775 [Pseudomonadota bacterium]